MPMIGVGTEKCSVCGESSIQPKILVDNELGNSDLGARPVTMTRLNMVSECPTCGYAASSLEKPIQCDKEYLKASEYNDLPSYQNTPDSLPASRLAKRFIRKALISIQAADYVEAFWSYLHAAWVSDDVEKFWRYSQTTCTWMSDDVKAVWDYVHAIWTKDRASDNVRYFESYVNVACKHIAPDAPTCRTKSEDDWHDSFVTWEKSYKDWKESADRSDVQRFFLKLPCGPYGYDLNDFEDFWGSYEILKAKQIGTPGFPNIEELKSPSIALRQRALQMMDKISDEDMDDEFHVIRADLLRRTGQFERLIREYENTHFKHDEYNKIVQFQILKAKNKDTATYTERDATGRWNFNEESLRAWAELAESISTARCDTNNDPDQEAIPTSDIP